MIQQKQMPRSSKSLRPVKQSFFKHLAMIRNPSLLITNIPMDMDELNKRYQIFLKDAGTRKSKGRTYQNHSKGSRKNQSQYKKDEDKKDGNKKVVEEYPKITFDYDAQSMLLSGKEVDLHPSREDVENDIHGLLSLFEKYNTRFFQTPESKKIFIINY